MGNISWRSQASSEDTDSSLQGDLDEDTGKDTNICNSSPDACMVEHEINATLAALSLMLTFAHSYGVNGIEALEKQDSDLLHSVWIFYILFWVF